VALTATLQVAAVIPNFLIVEYFVNFAEAGNAISVNPIKVEDGYINLPTGPGLGLDLKEDALKKYPFREFLPGTGDGPEADQRVKWGGKAQIIDLTWSRVECVCCVLFRFDPLFPLNHRNCFEKRAGHW
jgi:hypothetical protein